MTFVQHEMVGRALQGDCPQSATNQSRFLRVRAGSSVLGRLKPVSKPFDQVSHVVFAIWWFLRGTAASL
jgi:hypothetical protein